MKRFLHLLWPGLYGLIIYTTIRLVNDTISHFEFWKRDWVINFIEISSCFAVGYIMVWGFNKLFKRFDQQDNHSSGVQVGKELLYLFAFTQIGMSLTIIPMVALTDDGLSVGDAATIYIIPLLYTLVYYGVIRSRTALMKYIDSKIQLEKMTNDKLETELKFLRAQYHPHFLFNALNTIYFQMDDDVKMAKQSVEKFAELLRYQLYDQQQTVPVSQEVHYLKNYIDLQKVRSSEKLKLSVNFSPDLNGQHVYPLLFLPMVENAFKYVGGDYKIEINMNSKTNAICFKVINSVPAHINDTSVKKGGIGLEGLKRRLELLYPGQHSLEIQKTGTLHIAEMNLHVTS